jgi:hypothetical protein
VDFPSRISPGYEEKEEEYNLEKTGGMKGRENQRRKEGVNRQVRKFFVRKGDITCVSFKSTQRLKSEYPFRAKALSYKLIRTHNSPH